MLHLYKSLAVKQRNQIFSIYKIQLWLESRNSKVTLRGAEFSLTHFKPMFHFYTPWKHQKTRGFFIFSGGVEIEHLLKMGKVLVFVFIFIDSSISNVRCFSCFHALILKSHRTPLKNLFSTEKSPKKFLKNYPFPLKNN